MEAHHLLASRYAGDFPVATARRLDGFPPTEVAKFLTALSPQAAAAVIDNMVPYGVAATFEVVEEPALSEILACLCPTRCVLILRLVSKADQARMVKLLPAGSARSVERLLYSPPGSVAHIADPVYAVLSPTMRVGDSARLVLDPAVPYVYVVDDGNRLVGVVHRRDLARRDERARIAEIMFSDVVWLPVAAPLNAVRKHPAWMHFDALPVVDRDGVLVGVVREKNVRRLSHEISATGGGRLPALAAFLELGELYWTGLASLMRLMASGNAGEGPEEVEHGT